ncbi:Non-specific lipid-transfer protein-like protein [Striga hermonthica]|uniref:Non-specific lipid-transfer protein-like protein n=1 Tax=Striga hermonthica TaxID=68872 RepID=A0A9N7MQ41_STRHE|nr:Non-specific lipid-transfer protein-like protein [Striga hermonthica]
MNWDKITYTPYTVAKAKKNTIYQFIATTIFLASLTLARSQPPAAATIQVVTLQAAPPLGPDCLEPLANLADCLTYVEEGSSLTQPESPCCPEILHLINTNPICLCKLLANSTEFGLSDVNVTRALVLPSTCKINATSPTACQGMITQ